MTKKNYKELRKKNLIRLGFLEFEAEYYSQFPIDSYGMRKVIRFRQRELTNARKHGMARNIIPNYIRASYQAKGYTDKDGTPRADLYNQILFEELQKPVKERKTLFIEAERFDLYRHLRQDVKFTVQDARQVAEAIDPQDFDARMGMYKTLRKAYYSHDEALYIISAQTPPDKKGNTRLQDLDLTSDVWKRAMKERVAWVKQQVAIGKQRGLSIQQALKRVKKEIEEWYRKDKGRTPFDEIEDISPRGKPKPTVDFKAAVTKRRILKQKKEKMPWKVKSL
jgi:hypothetical protein